MFSRARSREQGDAHVEAETMAALRASKKILRQQIAEKLQGLSAEVVEKQSQKATNAVLAMKQFQAAKRISVYLSIEGKEIQTLQIIKAALQSDKQVFVPHVHKVVTDGASKESVMDMLALKSLADLESFQRDRWGIPSIPAGTVDGRENCFGGHGVDHGPSTEINDKGLDLIVVPGVGFDCNHGRLGHGKGYYDRFLSRCKAQVDLRRVHEMPFLVALALDRQVLPVGERVPVSEQDWLVDCIANGQGDIM